MRPYPLLRRLCQGVALAKLELRREHSSRKRPLRFEPLEDRRLLSLSDDFKTGGLDKSFGTDGLVQDNNSNAFRDVASDPVGSDSGVAAIVTE